MKLNVIVIDDSAVQLTLSSKLIEKNDHLNLVGSYTDPFLALRAVNNGDIDLVLLDVEMPEIDGFSLQKLFNSPVEVIINSTRPTFEMEAYSNGAIDFLAKPLSSSRLDLAVSRVLELKQLLANQKVTFSTYAS
jgi:DNA-binding NtrC family response regulator